MTFESKNYEEWFKTYARRKVAGVHSDEFSTFVAQQVDYLANPSIKHKNDNVFAAFLQNVMPELECGEVLGEVLKKIEILLNECYQLTTIEFDESITRYFTKEALNTQNKEIFIH